MTEVRERLFALQDTGYKEFQSKLMPTVDPDTVIGVRTPALRKLSKELWEMAAEKRPGKFTSADLEAFLQELPHQYYEENNLHAFFLTYIDDYGECVCALDAFLPYIDNWATCDMAPPRVLGRHLDELLSRISVWIASDRPYTVRYAIGLLMRFYLDGAFDSAYPEMVAAVASSEYYVNMMRAWYFATALAKQYERIVLFLEGKRLDPWTHNKTIQKAIESYRITPEQKKYLKGLKTVL